MWYANSSNNIAVTQWQFPLVPGGELERIEPGSRHGSGLVVIASTGGGAAADATVGFRAGTGCISAHCGLLLRAKRRRSLSTLAPAIQSPPELDSLELCHVRFDDRS
jgi:hypothetical protein